MTRLIDADKLCEEFKERQRAALRWKEKAILNGDDERSIRADATLAFLLEVKLTIDNAPTVDERPHGKWIMNKTSARGRNYTCTNCKKVSRNKYNFCPNCGADMRGDDYGS
ncbi:MAG: hypothetical protein IIY21_05555 [Clostridiales bacterium]|nr:hypothetical protein [Clostridiales bacterium]